MMKSIRPSAVNGTVRAPASKSMMQRAVACSLLCGGRVEIFNPSFCDDSLASLEIAGCLGSRIVTESGRVCFEDRHGPVSTTLNCREAGLCVRMFAPIAAIFDQEFEITGHGSLMKRPVSMISEPLTELGAECTTNTGFLPVHVRGPMKGGHAVVDGSISSQFLSGLLLALPLASEDSVLEVSHLKSRPYIDMTLKIQSDFGVHVENLDYTQFRIRGNQRYARDSYTIEGDWSSASFLLVAGAISGEVTVTGLSAESLQADRSMIEALSKAGASVQLYKGSVKVSKRRLDAFEFDATDCPDLFPPLVALAVHCKGVTSILGASRLKHKESDRGETLRCEFSKLGAEILIDGDRLTVRGGELTPGTADSCNDHRIAMALSVSALSGTGEVVISGTECVNKSYPSFFSDLNALCGSKT